MNAQLRPPPMPEINRAEDLPTNHGNLCREGGLVQLRPDDRRLVALLDIGERRVVALWAGTDRQVLLAALRRVELAGYSVAEVRTASAEVIEVCSESTDKGAADDALEVTDATRTFDEMLAQAYGMNASDLHIQMGRTIAHVRARIHGELTTIRQLGRGAAESIARAMYSQAEVDSRRSSPSLNPTIYQDAALSRSVTVGGRVEQLKLRWASGPAWPDAFDVAMRILNVGQTNERTLSALGFDAEQEAALMDALKAPHGVILMCGATGEGKSTTMATLAEIWGKRHGGRRMIRTIEDPPEYIIPNARHMPVSRNDGSEPEEGFHRALRAAMRMDPDALLLGEIRDAVTADLLEQATLTGHKVYATVHAASVFAGLWRLEELGIKRTRLAGDGFINAVIHQTLVQTLCPNCSAPLDASRLPVDLRKDLESRLDLTAGNVRTRGAGCNTCINGISGRRALASILIPDAKLRVLLQKGDEAAAIHHWRSGTIHRHPGVQKRSIVDQAIDLVAEGQLCPVDAEMKIGTLRGDLLD
ncbi:GspE/PulE family protein [Luteimonas sp. MHLX1A]|uniref:GspE/PulE family protein n=1 Tax=Alterluteimonas muca TaxID=2878684 RepID=UPI001E5F64C3|nr:ATPase, T2SS/T4P/T4SS family [Luteimonas sp. MHLX1A]MCD9046768.1 Flp pilus assembly complex ATPase component TadA [Luteimonas sp. MHLX1A]